MCKTLCFAIEIAAALARNVLKTEGKFAGLYTQTQLEWENLCALLSERRKSQIKAAVYLNSEMIQ